MSSDKLFSELFGLINEEKARREKHHEERKHEYTALDELKNLLSHLSTQHPEEEINDEVSEELIEAPHPESVQVQIENVQDVVKDIVERAHQEELDYVKEYVDFYGNSDSAKTEDPLTPFNQRFATLEDLQKHYTLFLSRIQTQLASIGGGGEVWFKYLNDVERSTMNTENDNWVLEYDASTGKVKFTDVIGPIQQIHFNTSHTHQEERITGTLCWDPNDQTLNLTHPGGVTQQIGQESYAYVRNGTANTISNGTPVMFAGAEADSESGARLLVTPIVADGTFPSLYGLGIMTQDLDPDEDGRVTVWGKVRELNTSAWDVGDILYADPNNVGQLTNVKPTAPNNVIPMAAVLKKDAAEGEIFVRPTINQMMYYGRFSRTTNVTVANPNQAYAIPFNVTDISNGIVFNGGTDTQIIVPDSGFYQFDINAQVTATSNKGLVYFWFRKNGVDIDRSSHISTITNGDTFNISTAIQISLDANDYVEIMWARTAAGILLDAQAATAFAPATSAVTLNVVQVQL